MIPQCMQAVLAARQEGIRMYIGCRRFDISIGGDRYSSYAPQLSEQSLQTDLRGGRRDGGVSTRKGDHPGTTIGDQHRPQFDCQITIYTADSEALAFRSR